MNGLQLSIGLSTAEFERRLAALTTHIGNLDTLLGVKRYLRVQAPTKEIDNLNKKLDATLKKVRAPKRGVKFLDDAGNRVTPTTIKDLDIALQQIRSRRNPLGLDAKTKTKWIRWIKDYKNALAAVGNAWGRQQGIIGNVNNQLGVQGRLLGRLQSLYFAVFGIQRIAQFAKKVAETTGYFEQQRVALEGIIQDASKAAAILNQIKDFSVRSPFQFKDLVGFTKQLSAFQIPADELFDTTKKLADISAGLGVDMGRIILAYGQVRAAAVLRGQELRQFTEAGIPLVDALAKKFSSLEGRVVSTGEVFERISKRMVSFEVVRDILFEMTEEGGRFNNMQEKIAETTYGRIQNLRDFWTISMSELGESTGGLINVSVKALQSLVKNWRTTLGAMIGMFATGTALAVSILRQRAHAAQMTLRSTIGSFFKANWVSMAIGVVTMVAGAVIGKIMQARSEAQKLKKSLDDIDKRAGEKAGELVANLKKMVKALQETTAGSEAERKAHEKLLSVYSEYLPQQDLEIDKLRKLKDGYDELTAAIIAQVQAKANLEKRDAIMQAVATDIALGVNNAQMLRLGKKIVATTSGGAVVVSSEFSSDFWEGFDKSIKKVIQDDVIKFLNVHVWDFTEEQLKEGIVKTMRPYISTEERSDKELEDAAKSMLKIALQTINKEEARDALGFGYSEEQMADIREAVKNLLQAGTLEYDAFISLSRLLNDEDRKTQERIKQVLNEPKTSDNKELLERLTDAEWVRGMINKYKLIGVDIDDKIANEIISAVQDGSKGREEAIQYLNELKSAVGIISKTTKDIAVSEKEIPFTLESLYTDNGGNEAGNKEKANLAKLYAYLPHIMGYLPKEDRRNLDWTSAYRSKKYNIKIGGAKSSQHVTGEAIDLRIGKGDDKAANERLYKAIVASGVATGQVLFESLADKYWVHMSLPNNKWNNNKQQLVNHETKVYTSYLAELDNEALLLRDRVDNAAAVVDMTEEQMEKYNKAVQNLLELHLQKAEQALMFYNQYEKKVNEYVAQLKNSTPGDAVVKTIYSLFRMSPQTNKGEYEKRLKAEYDNAVSGLKSRIEKNPSALIGTQLDKEVRDWLKTIEYVGKIAELINFDLNTGKGAEQTQKAYKAVADLFKVIKEGKSELSQIGAYKGYGSGLRAFVNTLSDDSVIKKFMDEDKNPFDEYLSALSAINIDTTSLQDVVNKKIKGTEVPDFKAMWDLLENALKDEIDKLTKSNFGNVNNKTIADLQRLYNQYFVEGKNIFSGDEVKNGINKIINELTKIGANTSRQIETYETFKKLSEGIGWRNAYKLMYGSPITDSFYLSNADFYRQQLTKMIDSQSNGIGSILGEKFGLSSILNAGALNISDLGALMAIMQQLKEYGETPDGLPKEEFAKIKDTFIDALAKLIEAILKESEVISKLASKDEKTANRVENLLEELKTNKELIRNGKEIDDKTNATIDNIQKIYNELREVLGGKAIDSYIQRAFKGNPEGGRGLEKFISATSNNGLNLSEMIIANAADRIVKGDEENNKAIIEEANDTIAAIETVYSTVKAINDAINTIIEAIKNVIETVESGNSMRPSSSGRIVDENGNVVATNKFDKNQIETIKKGVEVFGTFNTSIMKAFDDLMNGNFFGAILDVFSIGFDFIKGLNELHDLGLKLQQDDLEKDIERLNRNLDSLQFSQEFMTQSEVLSSRAKELSLLYQQQLDAQRQLNIETKKKAFDVDKAQEYSDVIQEKYRQQLDLVKQIREEIVGTADDLSSRLTDSFVEAFRNGTNAARAWRDQVKQFIGDILKEQLLTRAFAPLLQNALDNLFGGDEEWFKNQIQWGNIDDISQYITDRLSDSNVIGEFEKSLLSVGDAMMNLHSQLPQSIRDLIDYNSSTSSLSGGIQEVTEDTARRLEALQNAQLGETIVIRNLLMQYLPMIDNSTYYATIQSAVVQMNSNVSAMLVVLNAMHSGFNELRNTSARPLHVTMV